MAESTDSDAGAVAKHRFGQGRVSYIQIPASDVRASAAFYEMVFGWKVRAGSASHLSFTDTSGDMIGAFVTGRPMSKDAGVLPYL